mmetsp:Transcript_2941/g.9005  ORF Transcript_2941/g.9005 Transcript_2941/m.9005 type:complete len:301 (-) Transcript_2941:161-1063(-)
MLIGLVGPRYAGKSTVAKILHDTDNFRICESVADLDSLGECHSLEERTVIRKLTAVQAESLLKWPFFLLVAIDAPVSQRIQRGGPTDHESFLNDDDEDLFGSNSIYKVMRKARVCIYNEKSINVMQEYVKELQLGSAEYVRPSWDNYFLSIAEMLSERTNCIFKRSAAVIVKETRVVSTGYTGTPRRFPNCFDGGCTKCAKEVDKSLLDDPLDRCICICAEESAIIEAGRARCLGAVMYVTSFPCLSCAKEIKQAGITDVIYGQNALVDSLSSEFLRSSNVGLHRHTCILCLSPVGHITS